LVLQIPIGTSNTNWYFKYQLVLQIRIGTLNTNWHFKYQLELQIPIGTSNTNWYFKYQLVLRIPIGINTTPGPEDANQHDGLAISLPVIIQQAPFCDMLTPVFNIMTQCPNAVEHHKAEATLIGQFIAGAEDPVAVVKQRFEDNRYFLTGY
jgi:hypothetical protein